MIRSICLSGHDALAAPPKPRSARTLSRRGMYRCVSPHRLGPGVCVATRRQGEPCTYIGGEDMRNSCLAELGHNEAEGCDAICCGGEPGDSSGPECRCPWGQVRSTPGPPGWSNPAELAPMRTARMRSHTRATMRPGGARIRAAFGAPGKSRPARSTARRESPSRLGWPAAPAPRPPRKSPPRPAASTRAPSRSPPGRRRATSL